MKSDVTVQMKDAECLTDDECFSSTFYVIFNAMRSVCTCMLCSYVGAHLLALP